MLKSLNNTKGTSMYTPDEEAFLNEVLPVGLTEADLIEFERLLDERALEEILSVETALHPGG